MKYLHEMYPMSPLSQFQEQNFEIRRKMLQTLIIKDNACKKVNIYPIIEYLCCSTKVTNHKRV